jgi:hypothetical protein
VLNSCIRVSDYNEQYSLCQPLLPLPLLTLGLTRSTQRHTTPLHKHPLPTYLLPAIKNTTKAMDHLQRHGYDRAGNKHNISNKKRKHLDLSAWDRQHKA